MKNAIGCAYAANNPFYIFVKKYLAHKKKATPKGRLVMVTLYRTCLFG